MLASKVSIAVGAWVFCSLTKHACLSVPTNLAANLNMRKRSYASTVSKKGGVHTFISPRVRSDPMWLLGPDVTRGRNEGSELALVFACIPYFGFWRWFRDHALGLIAGPAFPEPPRVVGIRSRTGSFCDCGPVLWFFTTGGIEAMSLVSMARMTCLMSSLMGMFEWNLVPSLVTGLAKPSCGIPLLLNPPSNRFPLNGNSMGSARG